MKVDHIENMHNGWFIGDFEPTILDKVGFEVCIKQNRIGDFEKIHFHKFTTEVVVVLSGKIKLFDNIYGEGDIICIEPKDATSFEVVEDGKSIVIKIPGGKIDKYEV